MRIGGTAVMGHLAIHKADGFWPPRARVPGTTEEVVVFACGFRLKGDADDAGGAYDEATLRVIPLGPDVLSSGPRPTPPAPRKRRASPAAPRTLTGRAGAPPNIFDCGFSIFDFAPAADGKRDLGDFLQDFLARMPMYAHEFTRPIYDCGTPEGYRAACRAARQEGGRP